MNSRQTVTPVNIVAHRGYAAAYPENTLPAIKAALDVCVVAIEVDIHFAEMAGFESNMAIQNY